MVKLKGRISSTTIQEAANNGVSLELLRYRIGKGWSEEKAVYTPPRKQAAPVKNNPDMLALAEQNGISSQLYISRLRYGYSEYDAATMPKMGKRQKAKKSSESRGGIPRDLVERAAANGISYITLYRRLRVYEPAWDVEKAVTEAPIKDRLPKRNRIHKVAEDLGIDWRSIRAKQQHANSKYDPVILAIAEANGITYNTYIYRVTTSTANWDELEAATFPVEKSMKEKQRRARMSK